MLLKPSGFTEVCFLSDVVDLGFKHPTYFVFSLQRQEDLTICGRLDFETLTRRAENVIFHVCNACVSITLGKHVLCPLMGLKCFTYS